MGYRPPNPVVGFEQSNERQLRHRRSRLKSRRRRAHVACLALIEIHEHDLDRPARTSPSQSLSPRAPSTSDTMRAIRR